MTKPKKICAAEGCERPSRARGLCDSHYKHLRRWGDLVDRRAGRSTCTIEGCTTLAKAHGLCNRHYQRWNKYGDPNEIRTPRAKPCKVDGCADTARALGYCRAHYDRQHNGWSMEGRTPIVTCRMPNCWTKHHTKGLCQKHYRRWEKWGDPFFDGRTYPECAVGGCYKMRRTKHYCNGHYHRWQRYGDPLGGLIDQPWFVDLPMAPLRELVVGRGGLAEVMDRAGIWDLGERSRIEKKYERGCEDKVIDLVHADVIAVRVFGTHPALIWGEDYWTAEAHEPGQRSPALRLIEGGAEPDEQTEEIEEVAA